MSVIEPVSPDHVTREKVIFREIGLDMRQLRQRMDKLEQGNPNLEPVTPDDLWPITPPELQPPDSASELPAWAYLDNAVADLSSNAPIDLRLACLDYNLFDLQLNSSLDVVTDNTLDTAIVISLFTDRYDPETRQGGWWGDEHPEAPELMGSRLWKLNRSKASYLNTQTLRQAEDYARESLQWLLNDKLISKLAVEAHWERAATDNSLAYRLRLDISAILNLGSHYGKTLNRTYLL